MSIEPVRPPGVVVFVSVIVFIQAVLAAAAALFTIVLSGTDRVQAATGLSTAGLVWTGLVEAAVAVLLLIVAAGLLGGARGARLFVAVALGIRMASAVSLMMIHHTGGYLFNALIVVLISSFVLWLLYGYKPSDDYFTARDQRTSTIPQVNDPPS